MDSPSAPPTGDPNGMMWFSRRRHQRVPLPESQLIPVDLGAQGNGVLLDVSEGGMSLQSFSPLLPGKSTTLRFQLPGAGEVSGAGKVVWTESGRAGIQFVEFATGSRPSLQSWLSTSRPSGAERQAAAAPVPAPQVDVEPVRVSEADELDPAAALEVLLERAVKITQADGAAIAVGDERGMVCRASTGRAPAIGARVFADSGLSGLCLRTRQTVVRHDTDNDPDANVVACQQLNLRSIVILPVFVERQLAGVLEIFASRPNAFSARDVERLERLAELIASATVERLGQAIGRLQPQLCDVCGHSNGPHVTVCEKCDVPLPSALKPVRRDITS